MQTVTHAQDYSPKGGGGALALIALPLDPPLSPDSWVFLGVDPGFFQWGGGGGGGGGGEGG